MSESIATESLNPKGRINTETIRLVIARLVVRYGSASWSAKYREVDEEVLLKDWFHALQHFEPAALDYGLENLPADYLPNASQFRLICQRAPARERRPSLPAPRPDPARLKRVFERMHEVAKDRPPTAWIEDLEARRPEGLSMFQEQCLANARANLAHQVEDVTVTSEDSRRTDELKRAQAARVAAYLREHPELQP
jgi:hypothetical protein